MYDPSVIVVVVEIIIENGDDDGQLNGDVMGHRCYYDYDCDIVMVTSLTEVQASSKSADRPKVQQLYLIQLKHIPPIYRVTQHRRQHSSSSVVYSRT